MDEQIPQKKLDTQKMVCQKCFFIYDPVNGDRESNIEPYTNFAELPAEWVCPICASLKDQFIPYIPQ
jgi:rubredoxin